MENYEGRKNLENVSEKKRKSEPNKVRRSAKWIKGEEKVRRENWRKGIKKSWREREKKILTETDKKRRLWFEKS